MSRAFKYRRDGTLVVTLPAPVADVVQRVLGELTPTLASPEGDVGERLYPRAYLDPTEESAEETWQSVVHEDLVNARVAAVTSVIDDLSGAHPAARGNVQVDLDDEGASRWVTVLNDARLSLGTALDVTEDVDLEFAADDPRAYAHDCYVLLTAMQGELIEAMLARVPEAGIDDT